MISDQTSLDSQMVDPQQMAASHGDIAQMVVSHMHDTEMVGSQIYDAEMVVSHMHDTQMVGSQIYDAELVSSQIDDTQMVVSQIYGIGIDVVDVERFRVVLTRRPQLTGRLYTTGELDYAYKANDPSLRLAARFAAKEAIAKAMGTGIWQLHFANVEVIHQHGHPPSVSLHERAKRIADARGIVKWHLSITHTEIVAMAFAIAIHG